MTKYLVLKVTNNRKNKKNGNCNHIAINRNDVKFSFTNEDDNLIKKGSYILVKLDNYKVFIDKTEIMIKLGICKVVELKIKNNKLDIGNNNIVNFNFTNIDKKLIELNKRLKDLLDSELGANAGDQLRYMRYRVEINEKIKELKNKYKNRYVI